MSHKGGSKRSVSLSVDSTRASDEAIVRLAGPSDGLLVSELVALLMDELGFLAFDASGLPPAIMHLLESEGLGFVSVAEVNGRLVGMCSVSAVWALRTLGVYGIVQEMYVHRGWRDRGIGRRLLTASLDSARELGFAMVEVGTPPDGDRQGRFYGRAGFRRFGDRWRFSFV